MEIGALLTRIKNISENIDPKTNYIYKDFRNVIFIDKKIKSSDIVPQFKLGDMNYQLKFVYKTGYEYETLDFSWNNLFSYSKDKNTFTYIKNSKLETIKEIELDSIINASSGKRFIYIQVK